MSRWFIACLCYILCCLHGLAQSSESRFPSINNKLATFADLARYDDFSATLGAIGGSPPYAWSVAVGALPGGLTLTTTGIVSGQPSGSGPFAFTIKVTDSNGQSATKAFSGSVHPVPRPKPIDIAYSLTTIYMPKPSWPSHQWSDLRANNERNAIKETFGQRMPLLGYYRGDSPEVLDWQIKMAVDRGITCFMFNDYWTEAGTKPNYDTSVGAFLGARYRDSMTFGMLLNPIGSVNGSPETLQAFFLGTVLPYYVTHYFNRSNYQRIDGRPVLQFLHVPATLGTADPAAIGVVLDAADNYIRARTAFAGAYWITCDNFPLAGQSGFDAVSPYYVLPHLWPDGGWGAFPIDNPDQGGNGAWPAGVQYGVVAQESVNRHAQGFADAAATGVKFITAVAPDFDSRWIYWAPQHLYFSGQSHADYWGMLSNVRAMVDAHSDDLAISTNTGKPLVGLGPWNEQGESSTVEPGKSAFQRVGGGNEDPYFVATAAAKVFGGPSQYDSYLPGDLGRGFPAKTDWTFSLATGAGLDEWNSQASAGLALGAGDVLQVAGVNRVLINTPTYVPASSFQRVKMLVRVDEGAQRLENVVLYTKNSDYSATAHQFGAPVEPGHAFYGPLFVLPANQYVTVGGFREYTFQVGTSPQWQGMVQAIEMRFDVFVGSVGKTRLAIKRIWME